MPCLPAVVLLCVAAPSTDPLRTLDLAAKETLCVAELTHGDTLRFRLRSGQTRSFEIQQTSARIVERVQGGIVYSFECRLLADGQPLTLRRYVCSQETFYEPWVVNGVRLWFSSSAAIFKLVPVRYGQDHYPFDADVVLALQDATLPICPQPPRMWFPLERHFIDVGKCYNGDDPWLGPYLGQACHVGLDINMPRGTPLYAPLDFDDHWIFSADHRWRGVRRWSNGDLWALQSHHVDRLLVREGARLTAGMHYAEAAGKGVGSHPHSHFEFRIGPEVLNRGQLGGVEIDPWIFFWQMFETDKAATGEIRAVIDPLSPAETNQPVRFSAAGSRGGQPSRPPRYYWTFGDGGAATGPTPEHTFLRPGVYPVTLVLEHGPHRATQTQHLTVRGSPVEAAALVVQADETSFRARPAEAADVYGWPVQAIPQTLCFALPPSGPPRTKTVRLHNAGGAVLPQAEPPEVEYLGSPGGWLGITPLGKANEQQLAVTVDPGNLGPGRHAAIVAVQCPGATNGKQTFRVEMRVRPRLVRDELVIDDRDPEFFATPFCWVGHQFLRCPQRGWQNRYLTNAQHADGQAMARWTPDLPEGRYEVLFHPQTPFVDSSFLVRIRHATGEQTAGFHPLESNTRSLGRFEFAEGTDGYVEILAQGATGPVIADAVIFRRLAER
jgi:hypothetical protein